MSRTFFQATGLVLGLALLSLPIGCDGSDGAPGTSTGIYNGTVTNSANANAPLEGATVTTNPDAGVTAITDATGAFTATLPIGVYELTISAPNFVPAASSASIIAGGTITEDFSLTPVSNVAIAIAGTPTDAVPGSQFQLTATATPLDGSTVESYTWTQTNSAPATIEGAATATPTITLGDAELYKLALLDHLTILPDRFRVQGVDPHAYELGGMVAFECEVTTTTGSYTEHVEVHAHLDFAAWATGLQNVPVGLPVMLSGKAQEGSFDWAMTVPTGSTATLMDATGRFPYFTPDIGGTYSITVTDVAAAETVTLDIFAGAWSGGIDGTPYGEPTTSCAKTCHSSLLNDKFVDWMATGHAKILTDNINTGGHYSSSCFPCHTVGYGSGGIDSTDGYQEMLDDLFAGGMSHPDPDNWANMLANHPNQAGMANIQCENCHGPNGAGSAHMTKDADIARISVNSEVCATCHGEPPRHGRYQQWLLSSHSNFELAMEEGEGGSCNKCHTAQGFINWSRLQTPFDTSSNPPNLETDEITPIGCVTCHDPHNVGTRSGDANDIPMRWDHTDSPELLGGFTGYGMGHGSTCIICHNTRRGEAEAVVTSRPDQAPHGGAQGDFLLGFNGFWVTSGVRGPHSLIENTCSNCHLQKTDPPADLSYNLSGTNHTFAATEEVCADCHSGWDPASLIELADRRLHALEEQLATALTDEIQWHIDLGVGNGVQVTGYVGEVAGQVYDITAATTFEVVSLVSYHGRQAMNVLVDGVLVENVRVSSDTKLTANGTPSATATLLANDVPGNAGDVLARAGWNYWLVEHDGSSSMHNPGWFQQMMAATENQLSDIRNMPTTPR